MTCFQVLMSLNMELVPASYAVVAVALVTAARAPV